MVVKGSEVEAGSRTAYVKGEEEDRFLASERMITTQLSATITTHVDLDAFWRRSSREEDHKECNESRTQGTEWKFCDQHENNDKIAREPGGKVSALVTPRSDGCPKW